MSGKLFTIGCSVHSIEAFVALLKMHSVTALADVRSMPFSRRTPQFNAPLLKLALAEAGISYISMGEEFGARRKEREAFHDGRVDFGKVRELPQFQSGLERIQKGHGRGLNIAMMCTEKDPIDCHRFILVSRNVEQVLGLPVVHILSDGSLVPTQVLEDRLLIKARLQIDMFNPSREPLVEQAYAVVGAQIAYAEEKGEDHD